MDGIRSAGLLICILMVLMAYLKHTIPKGKSAYLMKAIISVFILLSIVNGLRNINWKGLESLLERSYSQSEAVWENTAQLMAEGLKEEFQRFLDGEQLQATVISVEVDFNSDAFSVSAVKIQGADQGYAAQLIASRYGVDAEKIEVSNDGVD